MELKSNQFIINLKTLNSEGDSKLEQYTKKEEISIDDVIKIITKEAERNNVKDTAKVTFESLEDDSIKIIVEKVEKQKEEIVIFPYNKIKSNEKEIILEDFIGKITLYNKEDNSISVTIDGVSLNLFSMTFEKAKELLCNITDRREKNGYLTVEDSVAYKNFGVVLKKDKDTSNIEYIEVYNKEEIKREYTFVEEKYDVDISKLENSLEYTVPEFNPEEILNETKKIDEREQLLEDKLAERLKKFNKIENKEEIEIEIEIPIEETKKEEVEENKIEVESNTQLDKEIEELTKLYEKQKEQQEILENRIAKKIEELKSLKVEKNVNIKEEVNIEDNKVNSFIESEKDYTSDDEKAFVIESYKGLKENGKLSLYLGQSREDIRVYFNSTSNESDEFQEMEMYENFYAYYDEENKCTGIGICNQDEYRDNLSVYLFGKNLITMPYKDIVKLIKDHDYKAIEDEDGIISLEYGISVDPKEERDYKNSNCDVIHLFPKGYYDEVYNVE